ncbi:MAG: protein kinase [Gemmatimonadaceae bacterium]|nr:protein kinase [Gemmatimonadaceae bacterium]
MAEDIRAQVQSSLGDAYTIERELGGGGMSRTYVAMERSLSRRVVVKVLSPELAAGVSVERFKREILLAAQLQHPHVVPVLSSGDANGLPWFTMPYVEGEALRARLARGPLPIGEAVSVLRDVARALAFAHSRGVVHRDIKPDNVLLSEGSATVTDFGIAKAISAARQDAGAMTLTMAGTSIGSPAYMSPEQAAGDPNVDHRSDIYAFGCMAYEVLAGRPPFIGQSPAKLLGAHLGEKPRDIRELRTDVPETLAMLVMQCLEKDPASRPQQANDLVRVLDNVTSSGSATAAPAVLAGRINIGKALGFWAAGAALVALTAWAATVVIGLPDWVLPGSVGVMLAGLPIIGLTAWVQRVAHRAYTATPTFTPGGTSAMTHGTLHTLAIKASPHVSWKRTWMGGAVAVGGFVVLIVGYMVFRALGIGPAGSLVGAGKLGAGDQIILADFKSPADDSTLGLTVTEALRADLSQSAILKVIPRLAVVDILRLMQRPTDEQIDFDLARAIASREGLKAVLDGDIVSLGGRYVLSTRLIAQDGTQLATFKEEAESQNDLIPAIGRLGKQLRTKAGESLKSVRETSALDRVTTGSLDALRKYTAANLAFEQTGDYAQAIPLMLEAVGLDSTFAMAWRRLGQYYVNVGRLELAQAAVTRAYELSDRLGEVERQLAIAGYHSYGPAPDEEKALAAYQAVLTRDSLNFIALNNASLILARRRELEKTLEYRVRATTQRGTSPITFANAVGAAVVLGRWETADSIQREFVRRFPTNPAAIVARARIAAVRGEYDRAAQLEQEAMPQIAGSRTAMIGHLGFSADLSLTRGKVREAWRLRGEQRERQSQAGATANARLSIGIDSVFATAVVLEDPAKARTLLDRAVGRAPVDSIPYLDRNYTLLLTAAAFARDSARAREWHAAARQAAERGGNLVDRSAWEAFDDALLAFARGRYADALAGLNEADRLDLSRTDILGAARFVVLDRLQQADSAIAAGESYLAGTHSLRLGQDALFLAGIRQRLGEMYEAKGSVDKALTHYQAFVELWKDADPELQPRVRDVRSRIERLQRRRG